MAVFVLDKHHEPVMPCTEKRARLLLERGRARVHKMYPFTIRLTDRTQESCQLQPLRIKLDPGSSTTGVAVVREEEPSKDPCSREGPPPGRQEVVIFLMEVVHRAMAIREALASRRGHRRNRRARKTRYRPARFNNRTRKKGWLPPSLQHRIESILSWVRRLRQLCPIKEASVEAVRFDTQLLQNPEVSGAEYQQGSLEGYEVREYLLEKGDRCCAYCGRKNVPLQIDHIRPRARGGSNRVSNLTLACEACNRAKGAQPVEKFLKKKPDILKRVLASMHRSLAPAAAVNSTRTQLVSDLKQHVPVEESTGGRTKFNRQRFGIHKTHALDAACVGEVQSLTEWQKPTLVVTCMGRGAYCRTRVNKHGARRGLLPRQKRFFGFQTGDMVKANVPDGKKKGVHVGRVAVRSSGSFNIQTSATTVEGIHHRHCQVLQRGNGYNYSWRPAERNSPAPEKKALRGQAVSLNARESNEVECISLA